MQVALSMFGNTQISVLVDCLVLFSFVVFTGRLFVDFRRVKTSSSTCLHVT
jgi:hypothetical protein